MADAPDGTAKRQTTPPGRPVCSHGRDRCQMIGFEGMAHADQETKCQKTFQSLPLSE